MYTWSPVINGSYFSTVTQSCSGNALVSLYFLTNCHEQFIDTKTEIVLSCQAERWSNSLWCVVASRLYICLYVYPSHSTRDTLIVQLAAVRGHHTPTEIYTSPSLATNRFTTSPHSCLLHSALPLLNCMLNGCWRVRHFGSGHSLRIAWVPAPAPWGKHTTIVQYTRAQICGGWLDSTSTHAQGH